MHERCDACGKHFDVLHMFFDGNRFLCPCCTAELVKFDAAL